MNAAKADSLAIKSGMILNYKILKTSDTIRLKVMIKEVSQRVIFDFILLSINSFYGRVILTPQALQSGTRQYNYSVKGDVILTDGTAVWMSQDVFQTLRNKGQIRYTPNGKEKLYKLIKHQNYEVLFDTKKIPIPALLIESEEDPKDVFIIADNANFPIILSMNLGFQFDLSEVLTEEATQH